MKLSQMNIQSLLNTKMDANTIVSLIAIISLGILASVITYGILYYL